MAHHDQVFADIDLHRGEVTRHLRMWIHMPPQRIDVARGAPHTEGGTRAPIGEGQDLHREHIHLDAMHVLERRLLEPDGSPGLLLVDRGRRFLGKGTRLHIEDHAPLSLLSDNGWLHHRETGMRGVGKLRPGFHGQGIQRKITTVPQHDPLHHYAPNMSHASPHLSRHVVPHLTYIRTEWRIPDQLHTRLPTVALERRLQLETPATANDRRHEGFSRHLKPRHHAGREPTGHVLGHPHAMKSATGSRLLHGPILRWHHQDH